MQTIHVRYLNKKAPAAAIYMANWPNTIRFFDLTRVAFPKPAEKKKFVVKTTVSLSFIFEVIM